jgi:CRISPR-associated exonuclease Cas4
MCLEEMLSISIPGGAIFYGRTRRRLDVSFDESLRQETEDAAKRARQLIALGKTPPPVYEKRCENCSLIGECIPKALEKKSSVKHYLVRMMRDSA